MKKNKGFTLIELLAVIVILAIIALIASPIIIGLIDDARKEAAANSASGIYHAVENVYAKVLLKNGDGLSEKIEYEFTDSGLVITALTASPVVLTGENVVATLGAGMTMDTITPDYNGTKPTDGVLTLDTTGKVELPVDTTLTINNFTCGRTSGKFTCE